MTRARKNSCIGLLLLTAFIFLGIWIFWIGTPFVVEKTFGQPGSGLTAFQVRQYGIRILLAKGDLIFSNARRLISEVPFEIGEGSSVTSISADLEKAGLIEDAKRFRDYLIYKGLDTKIRAGKYVIPVTLAPVEIANLIRSDNPIVSFYIYPGWRAEEIGKSLNSVGIRVSPEDFLRVVNNPETLELPDEFQAVDTLEGFLYPGQYNVNREITAEDLTRILVLRFITEAKPVIDARLAHTNLDMSEIITMASIIQRESLVSAERPMIASVFYNRLNVGMKLETDPTVQYAIGFQSSSGSWWKTLEIGDLGVQSPFNTYINNGLPPHPISNPDLDAINAVLYPEETPFIYFRANCDGSGTHGFSITYEEHLSKACQ